MTVLTSTMHSGVDPGQEMRRLFESQSKAQPMLRGRSAADRIAVLRKLRALLEANMEAVIAALAEDLAKPRDDAMADFGAVEFPVRLVVPAAGCRGRGR